MRRSPTLTGIAGTAAATLVVAMIGAIAITGNWPNDAPLQRTDRHGIVAVPAQSVARIEITEQDKRIAFDHDPGGSWRVHDTPVEHAVATHIDMALRLLDVSAPRRTFEAGEYDAAQAGAFGLDPPNMLITLVDRSGNAIRVGLGAATPAGNSQYARVLGRSELYLLARYVGAEYRLALSMAQRSASARLLEPGATPPEAMPLLPVSIADIWAVEIVAGGALYRFERDPDGAWFHHVGQHVHGPGGLIHKADPRFAGLIHTELAALERLPVEKVLARHPDGSALDNAGLEHPPMIMLMYGRDSSEPVARIEFGRTAGDGSRRYAFVRESDSLVAVPAAEADHVGK
ncbi:MAG TPA: hypothetical protein VJ779_03785, partial [Acetobacteraceae bacterium]|nr:hypothetical protein [Acetobacteraceae bacterium]